MFLLEINQDKFEKNNKSWLQNDNNKDVNK